MDDAETEEEILHDPDESYLEEPEEVEHVLDDWPMKVHDGLYIGSCMAEMNKNRLLRAGITDILQVAQGLYPHHPLIFNYMNIQVQDIPSEDLVRFFPNCFEFIDRAISKGGAVLVHCAAGVSRSATVVLGYLMSRYKMDLEAAVDHLKAIRPWVQPNTGFLQQLEAYQGLSHDMTRWRAWQVVWKEQQQQQYEAQPERQQQQHGLQQQQQQQQQQYEVQPQQQQQYGVQPQQQQQQQQQRAQQHGVQPQQQQQQLPQIPQMHSQQQQQGSNDTAAAAALPQQHGNNLNHSCCFTSSSSGSAVGGICIQCSTNASTAADAVHQCALSGSKCCCSSSSKSVCHSSSSLPVDGTVACAAACAAAAAAAAAGNPMVCNAAPGAAPAVETGNSSNRTSGSAEHALAQGQAGNITSSSSSSRIVDQGRDGVSPPWQQQQQVDSLHAQQQRHVAVANEYVANAVGTAPAAAAAAAEEQDLDTEMADAADMYEI